MPPLDKGTLSAVADRLDGLGLNCAFLGGALANLLLDVTGTSPAWPADDVDVILEVVASERRSDLEARLRGRQYSCSESEMGAVHFDPFVRCPDEK